MRRRISSLRRLMAAGFAPVFVLLFVACGDDGPRPPDAFPGIGGGEAAELVVSFEIVFTRNEEPAPVTRRVHMPLDEESPTRSHLVEVALRELVGGPTTEERARGITSFFSDDTRGVLRAVRMEGDTVVADFTDLREAIPNASTSAGSAQLLHQLNGTVFGVAGVAAARYEWDGSCARFWEFIQRECTIVPRPEPD